MLSSSIQTIIAIAYGMLEYWTFDCSICLHHIPLYCTVIIIIHNGRRAARDTRTSAYNGNGAIDTSFMKQASFTGSAPWHTSSHATIAGDCPLNHCAIFASYFVSRVTPVTDQHLQRLEKAGPQLQDAVDATELCCLCIISQWVFIDQNRTRSHLMVNSCFCSCFDFTSAIVIVALGLLEPVWLSPHTRMFSHGWALYVFLYRILYIHAEIIFIDWFKRDRVWLRWNFGNWLPLVSYCSSSEIHIVRYRLDCW